MTDTSKFIEQLRFNPHNRSRVAESPAVSGGYNWRSFLTCTTPLLVGSAEVVKSAHGNWFPDLAENATRNSNAQAFHLADLWTSFEDASVFGVDVPIVDSFGTYTQITYVPYLSALRILSSDGGPDTMKQRVLVEFFESKPPHMRPPLSHQLRDLWEGREVPLSASQTSLLRVHTSNISPKSWMCVHWRPIQQMKASNSYFPPSLLVYYSLARVISTPPFRTYDQLILPLFRGYCFVDSADNKQVLPHSLEEGTTFDDCRRLTNHRQSFTPSFVGCEDTTSVISTNTAASPASPSFSSKPKDDCGSQNCDDPLAHESQLFCLPPFAIMPQSLEPNVWTIDSTTDVNKTILHFLSVRSMLQRWLERQHVNHPDFEFFASKML